MGSFSAIGRSLSRSPASLFTDLRVFVFFCMHSFLLCLIFYGHFRRLKLDHAYLMHVNVGNIKRKLPAPVLLCQHFLIIRYSLSATFVCTNEIIFMFATFRRIGVFCYKKMRKLRRNFYSKPLDIFMFAFYKFAGGGKFHVGIKF